jgi:hypothetical protein
MYWGSRVFSAIAASPLLFAGEDQFVGGNNSRMVGSVRSVMAKFSSTFSGGGSGSLAGAGSGDGSLNCGSFFNSADFFEAVTPGGGDLFNSGELFFAMIAGVREVRVGARGDISLGWLAGGALASSVAGSSDTLIFSCGAGRTEVCDQSSRTAIWTAKDAAKKPASDREAYFTIVCYCGNLCLSKSRGCNEIDW